MIQLFLLEILKIKEFCDFQFIIKVYKFRASYPWFEKT